MGRKAARTSTPTTKGRPPMHDGAERATCTRCKYDEPNLFELRTRIDEANYRLERAKAKQACADDAVRMAAEAVESARRAYASALEASTRPDGGK